MRSKEAIKAAQSRYNEKQDKILIRLDKEKDADLIEKLASVPSKQGYIKDLIKSDIERDIE